MDEGAVAPCGAAALLQGAGTVDTRHAYRERAYWRWSFVLFGSALALGLAGASGVGAAPAAQTPQSPGAQRQGSPGQQAAPPLGPAELLTAPLGSGPGMGTTAQLVQSPTPTAVMAIMPPQTAANVATSPSVAQQASPPSPLASATPTVAVPAPPPQNAVPQSVASPNAPPAAAAASGRPASASGATIGAPNNLRMLSRGPQPGQYTLAWDPPTNESVTEYHIVTVGAGGDTPQQFRVAGNVTQQVIAGLNPTVGYVLAVVAVDTQGREGLPSNTVQSGIAPTATPAVPQGATGAGGQAAPGYGGGPSAGQGAPYAPTGPAGVSGPGYGGAGPGVGSPYAPAAPPVALPGSSSPGAPAAPFAAPTGPGVAPGYNAPQGPVPYGAPAPPQPGAPYSPPYVGR
jgi:hypothetical protein